ncbi:MAG: 16S rRNA (uracil(1498)-N(3))-methyltransferase, partial [Selenomonadaceae bacterium]|nr:16S rRNA (uracil(1498)-N(3))-methyltransferase [Selenomonadaceae bacterium]
MRRLFYKGRLKDNLEITGEDAHHLKNVYRAKINDEITVVDDFNNAAIMRITAFNDKSVVLDLVKEIELTGAPKVRLTLAFCLLKGEKTDFV